MGSDHNSRHSTPGAQGGTDEIVLRPHFFSARCVIFFERSPERSNRLAPPHAPAAYRRAVVS
jgi:hypothetical protein